MISTRKYRLMKRFKGTLTTEQENQISEYENSTLSVKFSEPEPEVIPLTRLPFDWLQRMFMKCWKMNEGKDLIFTESTKPIYRALTQYFARSEDFKNTNITENIPELKKGLLIIGDYGCGKTSMLRAFQMVGKSLLPDPILWFNSVSCNALVMEFEGMDTKDKSAKKHFFQKYNKAAVMYFDDFGTESNASNFGIKNLMKDILEERYANNKRTFLTSNLSLLEIQEKYGDRVYDRLQEMFNIIQMSGDSFRR
jgi:DNA replication protein DnaC